LLLSLADLIFCFLVFSFCCLFCVF
jgi:hypothetical protein